MEAFLARVLASHAGSNVWLLSFGVDAFIRQIKHIGARLDVLAAGTGRSSS
jgi:hypothetical protein